MKNFNVMIFTDIRIKKFLGVKMQLAFYDCAINGPLFFKLRKKQEQESVPCLREWMRW